MLNFAFPPTKSSYIPAIREAIYLKALLPNVLILILCSQIKEEIYPYETFSIYHLGGFHIY